MDSRPSNAPADVVSPRWGSRGTELGRPEIPGLRCAPTWAIESRPVGAEETSNAADRLSEPRRGGTHLATVRTPWDLGRAS